MVAAVDAQHLVDKVDDVSPYHTDLVDDDEFDFLKQFDSVAAIF